MGADSPDVEFDKVLHDNRDKFSKTAQQMIDFRLKKYKNKV